MNRWVLNYYYNSVYLELSSQYYSTPIKNSTRGPEEPQKLSYIKSLKIQNPKRYRTFLLLQTLEMTSLSYSRCKSVKNVKIDPQTTEIRSTKLNMTF